MSKGVLIFAFDSPKVAYTTVALASATLAKRHLNLPVTLITNKNIRNKIFDNVVVLPDLMGQPRSVIANANKLDIEWKNQNRTDAFSLSPYDQTLLIDADYFMFNNSLLALFETTVDFSAHDDAIDISKHTTLDHLRLSKISIPMLWATVIYFTKSKFAKSIFSMMESVKNNYHYYSLLHCFNESQYRNDYALSIASHALHGYGNYINAIPGRLCTLTNNDIAIRSNKIIYKTSAGVSSTSNNNLHIMDKILIQNEKFLTEVVHCG